MTKHYRPRYGTGRVPATDLVLWATYSHEPRHAAPPLTLDEIAYNREQRAMREAWAELADDDRADLPVPA